VDVGERAIFAAQSERLREIESWLAMLVVRHGEFTGTGWQYVISGQSAQIMRSAMPREELHVVAEYDFTTDQHTLDAV
jgi:hypothetical protein